MSIPKKKRVKNKDFQKLVVGTDKRCMFCGSTHGLYAHHIIYKSQGGDDTLENGVTLCPKCHTRAHDGERPGNMLRLSARQFVFYRLKILQDSPEFRWGNAMKELEKKI